MMQLKSSSLLEQFKGLEKHDQDAVIIFFNLHNAATHIYNDLPEQAQGYIAAVIEMQNNDQNNEEQE